MTFRSWLRGCIFVWMLGLEVPSFMEVSGISPCVFCIFPMDLIFYGEMSMYMFLFLDEQVLLGLLSKVFVGFCISVTRCYYR